MNAMGNDGALEPDVSSIKKVLANYLERLQAAVNRGPLLNATPSGLGRGRIINLE